MGASDFFRETYFPAPYWGIHYNLGYASYPLGPEKVYVFPFQDPYIIHIVDDKPIIHIRYGIGEGLPDEIITDRPISSIPAIQYVIESPVPSSPGMVILPLQGAGLGPVINEGETLSTSLLLTLLSSRLSESELSIALNARLDGLETNFTDAWEETSKAQSGYATHDDTIVLDHVWNGRAHGVELIYSHGLARASVIENNGGIEYLTVPDQEVIYGHSGFDGSQFTVKAAIVEKQAHVPVAVNWTPAGMNIASAAYNTTQACMALRVQGSINLINYTGAATMYLEMQVDGGTWFDIAETSIRGVKSVDILLAFDQSAHNFRFRGRATGTYVGTVTVDTVTESGSGLILSNDVFVKWSIGSDVAGVIADSRHYNVRTLTVENPTSFENIIVFFTPLPITMTRIYATVRGSNSPSVTINPSHTQDLSLPGTAILSAPAAINNTTTGQELSGFAGGSIPANSWISLRTTAQGGTVDQLTLTFAYDEEPA